MNSCLNITIFIMTESLDTLSTVEKPHLFVLLFWSCSVDCCVLCSVFHGLCFFLLLTQPFMDVQTILRNDVLRRLSSYIHL